MEIEKFKNNYDKDRDCWKLKKKEMKKYYKCNKVEYLVKNCRTKQKMKNRSV